MLRIRSNRSGSRPQPFFGWQVRVKSDIPSAFAALQSETFRDLRDVTREHGMICKALSILSAGNSGSYASAPGL